MREESNLTETYCVQGEYPWARYPGNQVFRHTGNKKWFARLIGSFRESQGIYPGYHMNKAHWISVALDGTVEDEKVRFLVDMRYELTKK